MTNNLFAILDGIVDSGYAEDILSDVSAIHNYAESMSEDITDHDAQRIAEVGKQWLAEQANGNGEWSRMRYEARAALES